MPTVLLIDRAGRGHALADALVRTNHQVRVHYARGARAISHPRITSYEHYSVRDLDQLTGLANSVKPDLIFVANTYALVDGFADALRERGFSVIGPSRSASQIESSKVFTKRLCKKYGIPQAPYVCFDDPKKANQYVSQTDGQIVVKADGLCAGNGSFVCSTQKEAYDAIQKILVHREFGEAGNQIVIEDRLKGFEFSYFGFFDTQYFLPLPMALDYPKSGDHGTGLTCAGVGSVSPHPLETARLHDLVRQRIVHPMQHALIRERLFYNGPIYFGCMLVNDQVYLLEINIRLGDPEAQAILPRIDSDMYDLCQSIANSRLSMFELDINHRVACAVTAFQGATDKVVGGEKVGAHLGWPAPDFGSGYEVTGYNLIDKSACSLYWGQVLNNEQGKVVTDGGRPFTVTGYGKTLVEARRIAYANIAHLKFEGITFRTDIGGTQMCVC